MIMKRLIIILMLFTLSACETFKSGYYMVVGKDIEYEFVDTRTETRYVLWIDYDGRDKKIYTTPSRWNSINIGDFIWVE